jgi:hypothetical protein
MCLFDEVFMVRLKRMGKGLVYLGFLCGGCMSAEYHDDTSTPVSSPVPPYLMEQLPICINVLQYFAKCPNALKKNAELINLLNKIWQSLPKEKEEVKMQQIGEYGMELDQVLFEISSTLDVVKLIVVSPIMDSFTSGTFQTEEQKRLAVSLLRHLGIQDPTSKERLTQLVDSIGLIDCSEANDQFNISLRALDTCSPVSFEKYDKYFTKECLKHYAIVLNILGLEEDILRRKLLTHSVGNVIGHLNSTIEYVELSGKEYDVSLMNAFKKLSTQYPVGED